MLPGEQVVRELLACAPHTLVGAQVAHVDGIATMLGAGALAAWTRRVPPSEVGRGLLELLGRPGPST